VLNTNIKRVKNFKNVVQNECRNSSYLNCKQTYIAEINFRVHTHSYVCVIDKIDNQLDATITVY